MIVGDGNFKTDHVKQKKNDDVWLYDGGGMVPNQLEYANFIKTALEIPTVSQSHAKYLFLNGAVIGPGGIGTQLLGPVYRAQTYSRPRIFNCFQPVLMMFWLYIRKHLAKLDLKPLRKLCWQQKPVTLLELLL